MLLFALPFEWPFELPSELPFGLSWWQAVTIAGIVHAGMGVAATVVAMRKGESVWHWLPMSLILGTPALIMALRHPSKSS